MNRHDGVSCDSCLIGNFRGRRYKCLICYDYDLCAVCYEAGATNTRHTTDHPMQCILTKADYDLYYGGEVLANPDMPQSFTCPLCGRMGFTEVTLQEHVSAEHADTSFEVVCPICASMPGGDPNLMTDDFAGHLALEHRSGPRDLISFLDEPVSSRHNLRRMQHNSTHIGRGASSLRPRRSNMHFREAVDPIAELLSQLSGVRRSTTSTATTSSSGSSSGSSSQLQQLQMQLQLERQQVSNARQQLERFPRRTTSSEISLRSSISLPVTTQQPQYLLPTLLEELSHQPSQDNRKSEHSRFVHELLIAASSVDIPVEFIIQPKPSLPDYEQDEEGAVDDENQRVAPQNVNESEGGEAGGSGREGEAGGDRENDEGDIIELYRDNREDDDDDASTINPSSLHSIPSLDSAYGSSDNTSVEQLNIPQRVKSGADIRLAETVSLNLDILRAVGEPSSEVLNVQGREEASTSASISENVSPEHIPIPLRHTSKHFPQSSMNPYTLVNGGLLAKEFSKYIKKSTGSAGATRSLSKNSIDRKWAVRNSIVEFEIKPLDMSNNDECDD